MRRQALESSRRRRRGFTLAEVLLVVAITAIAAAIALPRYNASLDRYRADTSARRLAWDLAMVQTRAKALSSGQTIQFTANTSQYQIVGMASLDHPAASYTVNLASDPFRATLTWSGIGADNGVAFSGWGIPDSGGTFTIQSGSATKTVTLDADTGAATVN